MRGNVACEEKDRHAQQFMKLREDRKTQVGQKAERAVKSERANEGEVIQRFIECKRRIERENKERDDHDRGRNEEPTRRPFGRAEAQRTADDCDECQRDERSGAELPDGGEKEACMGAQRQSERGAHRHSFPRAARECSGPGGCEQQ